MKAKLTLLVGSVLAILVVLELAAQLFYLFAHDGRYSSKRVFQPPADRVPAPVRALEAGELPRFARFDVLHPFVGFVRHMTAESSTTHGFPNLSQPVNKRQGGKILVGVFGGSVAEQLADPIHAVLAAELHDAGSSAEVEILNFALGGYKQPQQLLTLAYMMSLGAEFDIIVNIDGFNELCLSVDENYQNGVFPIFPRAWGARISLDKSTRNLVLAGKIKHLQDQQARLYEEAQSTPLRHSAVYGTVKRRQIARIESEISFAVLELLRAKESAYDFETNGPRHPYADLDDLLEHLVENWAMSSSIMHDMAAANRMEYYHFLQPNQYVPNSKQFSAEERSLPNFPRSTYATIVAKGYPLLKRRGETLTRNGVSFHDATMVFADRTDTIYTDDCCHYNSDGYRTVAEYVVNRIRAETNLLP